MGETDLVELALQVAKEVMGCRVVHCRDGTYRLVVPGSFDRIDFVEPEGAWAACPKYPTDWSAAGEVLQWIRQQDKDMHQRFYEGLADQWRGWCVKQETEDMTEDEWAEIHLMTGTSRWFILYADVPLAICLAALAAVRATKGG